MTLKVDIKSIKENLEYVGSTFNSDTLGYNRLAFSKEEDQAINWLKSRLEAEKISCWNDAMGNLFARIGPDNSQAVAIGSHLDTVKNGGLYDGALGVMIGVECLIQLKNDERYKDKAFELIVFKAEEGNPLGGTFGSRIVTGEVDVEGLDMELLKSLNLEVDNIRTSSNTLKNYKAFIEPHIEQGVTLEQNDNKIGVVTGISGILRSKITVHGTAAHSGTMPMPDRKDALVDASRIVTHINEEANKWDNAIVATVGQLNVSPNQPTIVPEKVEFIFEVRSGDQASMEQFQQQIHQWIISNFNADVENTVNKNANQLSKRVMDIIIESSEEIGVSTMTLVSGANHDANSLAKFIDTGMIFIPSIAGISHNPEEKSDWKFIEQAANVSLQSLINLNK